MKYSLTTRASKVASSNDARASILLLLSWRAASMIFFMSAFACRGKESPHHDTDTAKSTEFRGRTSIDMRYTCMAMSFNR